MSTLNLSPCLRGVYDRAEPFGIPLVDDAGLLRPIDDVQADVRMALKRNRRKSPDHYLAFSVNTPAGEGWITLCARFDPTLDAPDDDRLKRLEGKVGGWLIGLAGCVPGDVYVPKVGRRQARIALEAKAANPWVTFTCIPNGTPPWHEVAYSIVCDHLNGNSDPDRYVVRLPSWVWPRDTNRNRIRRAARLYDMICVFADHQRFR